MDQPLSAATKSTLLVWILWSVDVNDGQQSRGVSALRDKEVILHECGPARCNVHLLIVDAQNKYQWMGWTHL